MWQECTSTGHDGMMESVCIAGHRHLATLKKITCAGCLVKTNLQCTHLRPVIPEGRRGILCTAAAVVVMCLG